MLLKIMLCNPTLSFLMWYFPKGFISLNTGLSNTTAKNRSAMRTYVLYDTAPRDRRLTLVDK